MNAALAVVRGDKLPGATERVDAMAVFAFRQPTGSYSLAQLRRRGLLRSPEEAEAAEQVAEAALDLRGEGGEHLKQVALRPTSAPEADWALDEDDLADGT